MSSLEHENKLLSNIKIFFNKNYYNIAYYVKIKSI